MTHAESQILIVDLAFGELDAARAAEVEQHVQGCEECLREKQALDEARRVTAPLRALEEPSEGFDDRILAAAKAQAQLTHDGNIGQVVEVAGSVKPLGLTPSNIDSHGLVSVRRAEARRPRWMVRVALGGSVAAAAALALVVSTTLQNKHAAELAEQHAAYEIKIEPVEPAKKVELSDKDELKTDAPAAPAEAQRLALQQPSSPSPAAAPAPERDETRTKRKKPATSRDDLGSLHAIGSGGDTGNATVPVDFGEPRGNLAPAAEEREPPPPPPAAKQEPALPQAAARLEAPPPAEKKAVSQPKTAVASAEGLRGNVAGAAKPALTAAPAGAGAGASRQEAEAGIPRRRQLDDAESADTLEKRAEAARHAGDYAQAANLYRHAAQLHKDAPTPNAPSAAWDLAHAVECLAAAGQFDEARKVRDELVKLYPSEDSAFYAASRALREVEPAAPASDAVKR